MTARRLFQLSAWLMVVAIIVLSLSAPSLRPVLLSHNLEHALAFGIGGFAAGLAYPRHPVRLLGLLVVFAAGIELAQFFAPGRHPSRIDFIVDAVAACAGAAVALLLMRVRGSERR